MDVNLLETEGKGMDDIGKIIGERIKEAREKRKWNQLTLADQAEVTPAAISQIESGARTPSTPVLRRIAQALEVSMDYLSGRSDETSLKDVKSDVKVDSFFRNFNNLSETERQIIRQHVELMAKANKNKK